MRWPWTRENPVVAFDASIDVDLHGIERAVRPSVLEEVARRVRAMPGAQWISVEPHECPEGVDVRMFPAGSSMEATDGTWAVLRERVGDAAREALAARRGWEPAEIAGPTGFAEALSPSQAAALEQLAALAGQVARPEAAQSDRTKATDQAKEDVGQLARLLGFVLPVDGGDIAAEAVRQFGSFAAVLAAPEAELRRVPGLGTHSIAAIKLVQAAAVRLERERVAATPVLGDPGRLASYLAAALARERVEQFRILFLGERGTLLADEVQARGTVNHTPVYPREVVRRALALGAGSVVLVHNHPSGDPAPSPDDIAMTRQVQEAAAIMGIEVRDHVIVGNGRSVSFRESGLLERDRFGTGASGLDGRVKPGHDDLKMKS